MRRKLLIDEVILAEAVEVDGAVGAGAAGTEEPSTGPEFLRTGWNTVFGGLTSGDSVRSVLKLSTEATCRTPKLRFGGTSG